jgi:16S rRNA (guanine1516-N2)-methyltransferase
MRTIPIVLSSNAGQAEQARAASLSAEWGLPLADRRCVGPADVAVVVGRGGLRIRRGDVYRQWHPGMLHTLREAGFRHPWARLSGLQPGDVVLDGTLGLGTDATFLSELTGRRVVACETSPVIAMLTRDGLARHGVDVEVRFADSRDVLSALPDGSVDVVIADPMFDTPDGSTAPSLDLVTWAADPRPIDRAWVAEALRVARRSVVVKDRQGGRLLEALGAPIVHDRTPRASRYGAWRTEVTEQGR